MTTTTKTNPVFKFIKGLKPVEWAIIIIVILFVSLFIWQYTKPTVAKEKTAINPETKVRLYEFWGQGCPHCAAAAPFLQKLDDDLTSLEVHKYEVYYNRENKEKNKKVADLLGKEAGGVPYIVIGDEVINGYDTEETTGKLIKERVDFCIQNECPDKTGELLGFEKLQGFSNK